MRRRYFCWSLSLLFYLLNLNNSAIGQSSIEQQARQYFSTAEKYFLKEKPTTKTDQLAEKNYLEVIQLHENANINSPMLGDSYRRLASIALGRGKPDEAKVGYHKALALKKALPQNQDSLFYKELILLGITHFQEDRPDSAEWYYAQAENIASRFPTVMDVERIYNSFGAFHFSTGNFIQAINYYKKALSLIREDNPDYQEAKVSFTYNIANAQLKLSRYQEAIDSYRELLGYGIFSDYIFLNLGFSFLKSKEYDSARFYLSKSISSDRPIISISSLNAQGHVALENGSSDTAVVRFQQAITENKNSYSHKNALLNKSYLGLANVLIHRGNIEDATEQYQNALRNNSLAVYDSSQDDSSNLFQVISLQDHFSAHKGLAKALMARHMQSGEENQLREAMVKFNQAITIARHIQKTYNNDEAKLFLISRVYPIYEEAIAAAYKLYRLSGESKDAQLAFQISEKSKAAVLSEMLDELRIRSSARLSDSLIYEEKKWKQKITRTRTRLAENQDSTDLNQLRQALIDEEIGLARTARALKNDEKYYRLKYQEDTLDVIQLQKILLDKKDAMLEYFMGNDSLYSFLVTRDDLKIKSIALDSGFMTALERIKASLYDYSSGESYNQQQNAYSLYQYLLEPYEKELQNKSRLIIIPDGSLSYIPLEMLSKAPQKNHYLLEDYTFNYAYSAALLKEAITKRRAKETGSILAMAPFTGNEKGNIRSNGFKMLFNSKEEVEKIGGSIYLENKATKRLFLELASSYGIVHLATHASISSENPLESFIAFYPDQDSSNVGYRLYTHELYNMQLDSVKLVVLSACEAGNGQLVKGEGVISLARAFAYAGCPNIVTTLWKAQDQSTAAIASGLHDYLKKGYTKDEALRQSKLDYLSDQEVHPMLKTPYHWANFIFIGDPAPVYEPDLNIWWWVVLGSLLLLLIFLLIQNRFFEGKES